MVEKYPNKFHSIYYTNQLKIDKNIRLKPA